MHSSTNPVPATCMLLFVLAAFVPMLHRIMHIFKVVHPPFSDAINTLLFHLCYNNYKFLCFESDKVKDITCKRDDLNKDNYIER